MPKIGPWRDQLDGLLLSNEGKPRRERLTLIRVFEEPRGLGYEGSYDAVRRYAKVWAKERGAAVAESLCAAELFSWRSLSIRLEPRGRADQWGGLDRDRHAHFRLCHSRMLFVRAYPRESQEMVFDARDRAFRFFRGACSRGIYDNVKTAVDTVFLGKERQFNRRFSRMCGHYLVEPTACTPAAGWEKGQVENQVGLVRERFFAPRLRVKSYEELNGWLLDKCVAYAKARKHPETPEKTIWQAFEEERPKLVPVAGRFDGFHTLPASVSKTCLVRFDTNKYSVPSRAVGRPVEIQAYAGRILIRRDGAVIAEHTRLFGRGQTVYDPWRYVPIPSRKPGALRNGAPFKNWVPPAALERIRRKLRGFDDGDPQMVAILCAVLIDGLPAVEAACAQALGEGVSSASAILNILARKKDPGPPVTIMTPDALRLRHAPVADCDRHDSLRSVS